MTSLALPRPRPNLTSGIAAAWSTMAAREPHYTAAAIFIAILIPPTLVALALDTRTHLGIDVWIKPLKFQVALFLYVATLAWMSVAVPRRILEARWYRWHARAVVAAIAAELVWIMGAGAVGIGSHFNESTPVLAVVYPLMGLLATLLTSATTVFGIAILRDTASSLAPALRLGLGLGLLLTLPLTLVTAGTMSSFPGHEIGGDGLDTAGAMIMGWSRDGGDLRVAHFFATHAMHVLPLVGWLASHLLSAGAGRRAVVLSTIAYTGLVAVTFVQALLGRPFLPGLL